MSFHFRIGAKVVCVDLAPNKRGMHPRYASTMIPRLGGVYTVRDIFDANPYGYDDGGVLLVEIVNAVRRYVTPAGPVEIEQFFLAFRFRPVSTTSIDVFTRMLEPEPAREPAELVDA